MDARIYMVENNVNGKRYVGQTVSRDRYGHGTALQAAYKKYGRHSFDYAVLCSGIENKATLNALEKFWISVAGTLTPIGYNIESGGSDKGVVAASTLQKLRAANVGKTISAGTKAKISAALTGHRNPFFGKTHNAEALLKMSVASKRKKGTYKLSDETKAALSEIRKGDKNPMFGRKHSDETKAKFKDRPVSRYWLGKKFSAEHKAHLSVVHTCIHCGKSGKGSAMLRYHFGNCKFKEQL